MPQAYRHAFEQMERVQAEVQAELRVGPQAEPASSAQESHHAVIEDEQSATGAAQASSGNHGKPAPSEAELESMHARLRRELRHGMHLHMQESNPDSYYKDVEHHYS